MKVIFSGSVIAFKGNPIELTFGPSDARYNLIFIFKNDDGARRMDSALPNPNSLELSLFNFNSSLGSFSIKPLSIGVLDDRELFMHMRVYGSGKDQPSDPLIHITLYQELEASIISTEKVNQ